MKIKELVSYTVEEIMFDNDELYRRDENGFWEYHDDYTWVELTEEVEELEGLYQKYKNEVKI